MQLNVRSRRIAVTLVLLSALLPPAVRALAGPPGAIIHIRWQPALSDSRRLGHERGFQLFDGRRLEGDTWRYDLLDPSRENVRAILNEPAVQDTHGLDRSNGALDPSADRTQRRLRFPERGDQLVASADLLALLSGGLGLFLMIVAATRKRSPAVGLSGVPGRSMHHARETGAMAAGHTNPRPLFWTAAVLAITTPFLFVLCLTLWRSPFPITEAVALFEDVQNRPLSHFFSPTTAYYRPVFHVMLSAFWHGAGSLDTTLALVKFATIIPILLLVVLFIWNLRPRSSIDAAAATFAVAVLVGSPGFRDNTEIGLSYTIVGMAIALVVWIVIHHEPRRWHAPLVALLTLVAIGFKEQGLVIVPIVMVAWWTGAPGANARLTACLTLVAVAYVALRLSGGASWELFQQDVGLGFSEIDKRTASVRFAAFPYWMYAYNSLSTLANILFAEPTRGTFRIVRDVVDGEPQLWQALHLVSSTGTTALIAWWGVRSIRTQARGEWTVESRLFLALIAALLACTALSFNYSRDRLGGMAAVFYAMAAFFAVQHVTSRMLTAPRVRLAVATIWLMVMAVAWHTRVVTTLEYARVHSWGNQEEWFVRLPTRRLDFSHRPVYLEIMESMIEQGTRTSAPHPTRFPDWVTQTIGRP